MKINELIKQLEHYRDIEFLDSVKLRLPFLDSHDSSITVKQIMESPFFDFSFDGDGDHLALVIDLDTINIFD